MNDQTVLVYTRNGVKLACEDSPLIDTLRAINGRGINQLIYFVTNRTTSPVSFVWNSYSMPPALKTTL
jgi:hypothetical protein